jgi:hypothetical protein
LEADDGLYACPGIQITGLARFCREERKRVKKLFHIRSSKSNNPYQEHLLPFRHRQIFQNEDWENEEEVSEDVMPPFARYNASWSKHFPLGNRSVPEIGDWKAAKCA